MTMEIGLAKRDFITQLWEETQHDERARDLIFGEVMEAMEAYGKEVADEREDQIKSKARDDVKEELIDYPPDDLRARVIKDLIEYPPTGSDFGSYPAWIELRQQIKSDLRSDLEDEMGDLRLANEILREEIARLKGEKYEPPEIQKTKRGGTW